MLIQWSCSNSPEPYSKQEQHIQTGHVVYKCSRLLQIFAAFILRDETPYCRTREKSAVPYTGILLRTHTFYASEQGTLNLHMLGVPCSTCALQALVCVVKIFIKASFLH